MGTHTLGSQNEINVPLKTKDLRLRGNSFPAFIAEGVLTYFLVSFFISRSSSSLSFSTKLSKTGISNFMY